MISTQWVGTWAYAQTLPVFDFENFEIMSVAFGGKIVVKSNDHDFYCELINYPQDKFVAVTSCVPFIFRSDADVAGDRAAAERAAADALASVEALKNAVDDAKRAKRLSALSASQALIAPLLDVTNEDFQAALVQGLKDNSCVLKDASKWAQNDAATSVVWSELGLKEDLTDALEAEMDRRLYSAIQELKDDGLILVQKDGYSIKLRDCR